MNLHETNAPRAFPTMLPMALPTPGAITVPIDAPIVLNNTLNPASLTRVAPPAAKAFAVSFIPAANPSFLKAGSASDVNLVPAS